MIVAVRYAGTIGCVDTVTLAARVLLAAVFGLAALTKLRDRSDSLETFQNFGVGDRLSRVGATLLAPSELAVAVALVFVPSARWGGLGAVLLLLVFIAGILNALRQGRRPDCGCFGGLRPKPIGRSTVLRNVALLAVGAFVTIAGPGPAIDGWLGSRSAGALVVIALVVLGAVTVLVRTAGSAVQTLPTPNPVQPASVPVRPKIGQSAPSFDLRGACGESRTLGSLCEGGRPLVLVFGNTSCGACVGLFPNLGRWQDTLSDRLQIAVIGVGDPDATRKICEEYGVAEVLVDPDGEVANAYGRLGTPSAFTVSTDGTIASGPALGADAIEDLVRLTIHRDEPMSDPWKQTTQTA